MTDPEVLGDVLAGVPVELHPLGGSNVVGMIDLTGSSESGTVRTGCLLLQRRSLFDQLPLMLGSGSENCGLWVETPTGFDPSRGPTSLFEGQTRYLDIS